MTSLRPLGGFLLPTFLAPAFMHPFLVNHTLILSPQGVFISVQGSRDSCSETLTRESTPESQLPVDHFKDLKLLMV